MTVPALVDLNSIVFPYTFPSEISNGPVRVIIMLVGGSLEACPIVPVTVFPSIFKSKVHGANPTPAASQCSLPAGGVGIDPAAPRVCPAAEPPPVPTAAGDAALALAAEFGGVATNPAG